MQFTATKLFTAFLALIALMQFVSGAALYSEMKDDDKITVSVSDVALTDGCAPTVSGLFSLVFVFCWFRKFSSFTSSVWRRKHHERIENRRELTFNREICSLLCRDWFSYMFPTCSPYGSHHFHMSDGKKCKSWKDKIQNRLTTMFLARFEREKPLWLNGFEVFLFL